MHWLFSIVAATLIIGCGGNSSSPSSTSSTIDTESYIRSLERANNISYDTIINTRASYVTLMCYTKTKDQNKIYNPCYACHTTPKEPNYFNETDLQRVYNFPQEALKNHFSNAFKDRSEEVAAISDDEIERYIRQSNYKDEEGIILARTLPKDWKGYRPDCYFDFDSEGFDRDKKGEFTGWRAFRYYPFLGTFWPTNGSTDDVLIRLAKPFRADMQGRLNKKIYKLNLAIVEALIKQKDINLEEEIDEREFGVDLDGDGELDRAQKISPNVTSYVGLAKKELVEGRVHLAKGLFPEGTEFLHSVRYIDATDNEIKLSARMKELRYAKKIGWMSYSELQALAHAEFFESEVTGEEQSQLEVYVGDYERGLQTGTGWVYQGFIEDRVGNLRPQTKEETINCMGCHARVSATTDTIYSFPRKFEGIHKDKMYGWGHWLQNSLKGIPEPKARYQGYGEVYEYSFYLKNNHSGNEFRDNEEVKRKFFNADGMLKEDMFQKLHQDISILLYPSKQRALKLNKAYKIIVQEQSYIYGRAGHIKPLKNVYKEVAPLEPTGIEEPIVKEY